MIAVQAASIVPLLLLLLVCPQSGRSAKVAAVDFTCTKFKKAGDQLNQVFSVSI